MKRFLALAALVLGLASCQTEPEGLNVNVGGEVDTYVTVSLPETTRATDSAEGAFANIINNEDYTGQDMTIRYVFQVFYGEGENQKAVQKQVYYTDYMTASFPVRLVPGRDYNFVAWADIVAQPTDSEKMNKALPYDDNVVENHYNADNLNAITLNDTWVAMDETRDAYSGFHNTTGGEKYTGTSSINIQMTRPFAKLRVITTDMVELNNLGITPYKAVATYTTTHYESFNALNGTYAGEVSGISHTYDIVSYDDNVTTGDKQSKVLFTDYFFANNEVVNFTLDVMEENGTSIKLNTFNTPIPAQRNYLTTIQGNVLTDGNKITVDVTEGFANANDTTDAPYYQETISSADEFLAALDKAGEFIVISDITIADAGTVVRNGQVSTFATRAGDKTIVDLNYHTITVKNAGTGAITKVDSDKTVAFVGEGEIILEEGSKGSFILNEGIIDVACASVVSNSENIEIFDGGTYTNYLDELRKAFRDGGEYAMKYDVTIDDTLTLEAGKTLALNLNGKTIAQTKECTGNYNMILNKGELTITGNGKISFKDTGAGDPNFGWGSYTLRNEGTLVVENGTIEHVGEQNPGGGQPNVHMYCAIFQYSGKSTINGGVISTPTYRSARLWNGEMTINGGQFVGQLWLQAVSDNANLVINGGEFTACGNDGSSVFVSNSGKAVKCSINGGLFNNKVGMSEPIACIAGGEFTPAAKEATSTDLLAGGYQFAQLENGNWTVEFVISNVEQLKAFRDAVDGGATFEGKTVKLDADIDLTTENWDPIGDNRTDAYFCGTFDGQDHTITGAHITGDHCFNGNVYGSKEGWGLFSVTDGATIKNLKVDGAIFGSYTVISGTIAAYAHDTTFENIEISNTKIAGYNWYTGGVAGWASGECKFKGINLDETVAVGSLWDSHGQNAGGIAGGVSASAKITIEDCNIACVLDVINDVTSNYKWCVYRVAGMIIGNTNTTETKYNEVVTASATNVTCKNVTVTYGKWMNYHYCEGFWNRGWGRYESSDYIGGVDEDEPHNHAEGEAHCECFPFDQLFGGSSNGSGHYPVKGLAEFPGVTVVYPAEYTCEICGEQHNVK